METIFRYLELRPTGTQAAERAWNVQLSEARTVMTTLMTGLKTLLYSLAVYGNTVGQRELSLLFCLHWSCAE